MNSKAFINFVSLYLCYLGAVIVAAVFVCGLYTIVGAIVIGYNLNLALALLGMVVIFVVPLFATLVSID